MISEQEYKNALQAKQDSETVLHKYHQEQEVFFKQRLANNVPFKDEELIYSRYTLCPCGHGLAYPKSCSPGHYWDCSAILKGVQDPSVKHTDHLPFFAFDVKGEIDGETTRGVFRPRPLPPSSEAPG